MIATGVRIRPSGHRDHDLLWIAVYFIAITLVTS